MAGYQGFYFARPMSAENLHHLVSSATSGSKAGGPGRPLTVMEWLVNGEIIGGREWFFGRDEAEVTSLRSGRLQGRALPAKGCSQ